MVFLISRPKECPSSPVKSLSISKNDLSGNFSFSMFKNALVIVVLPLPLLPVIAIFVVKFFLPCLKFYYCICALAPETTSTIS